MTCAAVVILYEPSEEVVANILSYAPFVSRLYIVDNTEKNSRSFFNSERLSKIKHIHYIDDGENKGIAFRINEVARIALEEGFKWLLTMDQDSAFETGDVPRYFECINAYANCEKTAMFGVETEGALDKETICESAEVTHLITSGSMLNLELFQTVGGFDEHLFIDKVDHDYCLQALTHQFKIVRFNSIHLRHHLGKLVYGRSLKNFQLTPRVIHSPLRMYYIFRNYLYLKKKYQHQFPENFREMREELVVRSKNNFLYGTTKVKLLKYLLKAYSDFKKNKMGKIS